jgi:hypothetical protein
LTVDRRVFLRETVLGAGVVACGVGWLWVRSERSRSRIVDQMMDSARPVLDKYALEEQEQIPGPAGEAVRRFFDGICLNTAEFVDEISDSDFRKKLSKKPAAKRHLELQAAFYRHVPDAAKLGQLVDATALEFGPKLDEHWNACCAGIAKRWEVHFQQENGPRFDAEEFSKRVTPTLRSQVEQAVRQSRRVTDESSWRGKVRSFSVEALEAGPDFALDIGDETVRLPAFAAKAWQRVFKQVVDLLGNPNWECQHAMTARLAELGNQIGAEFEKELRRRLNDLRAWRENAVRQLAERHAAEKIGFFGERE